MSRAHDIDNEDQEPEPLFQFDAYDLPDASREQPATHREALSVRKPRLPSSCPADRAPDRSDLSVDPSSSSRPDDAHPSTRMSATAMADDKGKGISQPMPVPVHPRDALETRSVEAPDDLFSMSVDASTLAHIYEPDFDLTAASSSSAYLGSLVNSASMHSVAALIDEGSDEAPGQPEGGGKGKAREQPPSLPPLSFVTTELNMQSSDWPVFDISSSIPGPSSFGSGYASTDDPEPSPSTSAADRMSLPLVAPGDAVLPIETISRRRTFSNSSARSARSISAASLTKVKVKLAGTKTPGNLARKLLFKKRESAPNSPGAEYESERDGAADVPGCVDVGQASCFTPWTHDLKGCISPAVAPVLDIDISLDDIEPAYTAFYGRPSDHSVLRPKGRSYSSPLPLPSTPLDLIPDTTIDIFAPVPTPTPNYFEELLPVELRLHVLVCLVDLHESEHAKAVQDGKWTLRKATASKNRWVGRDRGIRELFKLSRVSRAWRSLVFDGQLWARLDLRTFPSLPPPVLLQLAEVAGSFISQLDLSGHTDLSASTLVEITNRLCMKPLPAGDFVYTHLTVVNLQGCSTLTADSLRHLLTRSPSLRQLCLRGLPAVHDFTCDDIARHCTKLVSLDLSRCHNLNLSGDVIRILTAPALARKEHLPLKELRLSGLRVITDRSMAALGRAAPFLEVLDLSYARDLHNSAVEAFVSCTDGDLDGLEVVQLTAREAGLDPTDPAMYKRRVTHLRHLNLSFCTLLTDHACSHLAHAVPRLEFMELAGIGPELRDPGLVRLLNTTPHIRRLDLEDSDISDDVLIAITPEPAPATPPHRAPAPPQPGHALEHLIISNAADVTNETMLALMARCTRLRVLEADSTRLSGPAVREFVRVVRERTIADPQIVAIDCRGVGEQTVRDLAEHTRPRIGWRAYEARKLGFLDARDEEGLGVGQDECDPLRVALKTFYSWQTVDAVRAAREKKRKTAKRGANVSSSSGSDGPRASSVGRARWWSPSGRRSEAASPVLFDLNNDNREGCTIM